MSVSAAFHQALCRIALHRGTSRAEKIIDERTGMLDLELSDRLEILKNLRQFLFCWNSSGLFVRSLVGLQSRSHATLYVLYLEFDDCIGLVPPERRLDASFRGSLLEKVCRVGPRRYS